MQTIGSLASGHKYNPRDTPNIFLSWDASVASSITDAGSGAVSLFADWRTAGPHQVGQSTGANRPTTGTRTLNGLNVLDFDGTNDSLAGAFDAWTQTQPFTGWLVAANDDGADSTTQVAVDRSNSTGCAINKNSSNQWQMSAGTAVAGGTCDTNPHYFTAVWNGASSVLRVDGVQVASGNAGSNGFSNHSFCLGKKADDTLFWDGYIAEFIFATGVASASTIADVESYLKSKWGI